MIEIEIKGAAELERKLMQFGPKVAKKVVRSTMREGAKIVRQKTKQLAPVKSGDLKKSIVTRTAKQNWRSRGTFALLQQLNTARYPKLIKHTKKGIRYFYPAAIEYGRAASGDAGGRKVVAAKSFIRQGFNETKDRATAKILTSMRQGILKLWKTNT